MTGIMPAADFWSHEACHAAVDPRRPGDAQGLVEWAAAQGMKSLCFFQTSGSEGRPKWVALEKQAFLISGAAVNAHLGSTAADRWLVALPQHHVGGFAIHARAHLSGASVITRLERWEPAAFHQTCVETGATLVSLVPTQVHDLACAGLRCPPGLRAAIIGGGGMSPELAAAARGLGWPVLQSYGMTEAASQIATQPLHAPHRPMQVLPHWQARTDDNGRLVIRGAALAAGYVIHEDGPGWRWQPIGGELVTRDLVTLHEDAGGCWLEFRGREAGYVKILGELVHLAPLQARLDALALSLKMPSPPVIVPLQDARRETRLLLVTEDHPAADELLLSYNESVEPLHQASGLHRLSTIPRTPLGKVDSPALLQLLAAGG